MAFVSKPVKDFDTSDLREHIADVLRLSPLGRLESVDGSLKKILEVLKKIEENTRPK